MASPIVIPNNFVDGQPSVADDVDENFAALSSWINSNAVHLDGSKSFTNPVGGATPTTGSHLTTKAYVDGRFPDSSLDGVEIASQSIPHLIIGPAATVIRFGSTTPTGSDLVYNAGVDSISVLTTGIYSVSLRVGYTIPLRAAAHIATSTGRTWEADGGDQSGIVVVSATTKLTAGTTVQFKTGQYSGASRQLSGNSSWFEMHRVR